MATIYDKGKPTLETAGKVGDIYVDTNTGLHYKCQLAYKDEPNEALSYDWRQIPVDDDMVDYLKLAETERYKSPWVKMPVKELDPSGSAATEYKFNDVFGEVVAVSNVNVEKINPENGIYSMFMMYTLSNPDNRTYICYDYAPTNNWLKIYSAVDENIFHLYADLRTYECTDVVIKNNSHHFFIDPSTVLFSNISTLAPFTITFTKNGTVRGILLPKKVNSYNATWLYVAGADQVTIKKIHGNGLKIQYLFLSQAELVLSDETIKYLVETLGDVSDEEKPSSIRLSKTNLANISEETHNLALSKGWVIS